MTTATRNVHQRKLAVMAKCSAVVPDKKHPAHGFDYVSIQTVSNHLRKFCVEEGLDVNADVVDGEVLVHLINAEEPTDRITSRWPVVAGDKGFAYSLKFPLMRLFLIGDGEENDEAVMGASSGQATTPPATNGSGRGSQTAQVQAVKGEPCPQCFELGIKSRKKETPHFWTKDGRTSCNGYENDAFVNHKPLAPVGGDVNPDEIPF